MQTPYQTPQTTQPSLGSARLSTKQILFSIQGRIPRSTWWLYTILASVAFMAVIIVLTIVAAGSLPDSANAATAQSDAEASSGIVGLIMLLLYIPYTWITICLNAKRMHDCDNSGWMQLIPVYSFIVIGFFAGTTGPNRFGENPLSQK